MSPPTPSPLLEASRARAFCVCVAEEEEEEEEEEIWSCSGACNLHVWQLRGEKKKWGPAVQRGPALCFLCKIPLRRPLWRDLAVRRDPEVCCAGLVLAFEDHHAKRALPELL